MNTARALYVCVLLTAVTVALQAQTIDDGGVLPRHRSSWATSILTNSGTNTGKARFKRTNGNIGTLTTRANTWCANYGLTDRVTPLERFPTSAHAAARASSTT